MLLCAQRTSTAEYEPRYQCAPLPESREQAPQQHAADWPRIRAALMFALAPFKEAREAVIRALLEIEAAEAPS